MIAVLMTGTRGRIQRSVREDECEGSEMDVDAVVCPCRHLRMAIDSSSRILHETEISLIRYADASFPNPVSPGRRKVYRSSRKA